MYVYLIRTLVLINPLTAKCMYMYVYMQKSKLRFLYNMIHCISLLGELYGKFSSILVHGKYM